MNWDAVSAIAIISGNRALAALFIYVAAKTQH